MANIYTYLVNQKFTLAKYALSNSTIHPHVSVALASVITMLYRNTDKMQQILKLLMLNHVLLSSSAPYGHTMSDCVVVVKKR